MFGRKEPIHGQFNVYAYDMANNYRLYIEPIDLFVNRVKF